MSGIRYEAGRDMPPGMQELLADKLVKGLRETAAICRTVGTFVPGAVTQTIQEVKGDPCDTCLRWDECNGVDEGCAIRETQGG